MAKKTYTSRAVREAEKALRAARKREDNERAALREHRRNLHLQREVVYAVDVVNDDVLKRLHTLFWSITPSDRLGGLTIPHPVEGIRLTPKLWELIKTFVSEDVTIIAGLGSMHGFSVYLILSRFVYSPYPGVDPKLKHLLSIHQDHLPRPLRAPNGTFIRGSGKFEDGWRYFTPISHSDLMRARRNQCGLKPPVDKSEIEY